MVKGKLLDFAVENCIDGDGNQRCSAPLPRHQFDLLRDRVEDRGHPDAHHPEVRDVNCDEVVFYRDTNGQWTPPKTDVRTGKRNTKLSI